LAFALPAASNAQTTATTDPVGFVTVGIVAGSGTAKKNTLFSVPLLESETITGQVAGTITGVTSNTIVNTNAGWSSGALSAPTTPYIVQITTGTAAGRQFLIASSTNTAGAISGTANTANTLTVSSVDAAQVNLSNIGVAIGDQYKIYACDTLSSFFGTPGTTGVSGGTSTANADTIVFQVNGAASTYYYNTSLLRWTKVAGGNPDSSNVALPPYSGVTYSRLANTPLSFVVTGQVPTIEREMSIKNAGGTVISQFWPTATTLSNVGLQTIPGWTSGASVAVADTVVLVNTNGSASTYWYTGTNWKKVAGGSPISDSTLVEPGTAIQITKKGTATGYSPLNQALPYNLNN
jgi:hypothetical protein